MDEDRRASTLERVLAVLNELLHGKEHDRRTIAALGGVTPATADRDIRFLEKVDGVRPVKEGKRRVLRFDPQKLASESPVPKDAAVIAACLGTSLARVFDGSSYEQGMREALQYILGRARRRKRFRWAERKFLFVHRGGEAALKEKDGELDEIIEALLHSRFVTIDYRHFNGNPDVVRIMPLSLAIYDHQLYVIGRSDDKPFYPYRFSRIQRVDVEDIGFDYPPRSDYDPDQVFLHSFGIFIGDVGEPVDVEVLLSRDWETYASTHRWHPTQRTTPRSDGVLVAMHVRLCRELESWILGFGEEARVLKPASLVEKIAGRIAATAERYKVGSETVRQARKRSRSRKSGTQR